MDSPGQVFTMLQPAGVFQSIIVVELRFWKSPSAPPVALFHCRQESKRGKSHPYSNFYRHLSVLPGVLLGITVVTLRPAFRTRNPFYLKTYDINSTEDVKEKKW